jgi:hypothetical protein
MITQPVGNRLKHITFPLSIHFAKRDKEEEPEDFKRSNTAASVSKLKKGH